MASAWHEIRDHLMQTSSTLRFQRSFDTIRRAHHSLAPFRDPAAMLDALHHGPCGPDRKNLILKALVEAALGNDPAADCVLTLMLLALWPGLDAVHQRCVSRKLGDPDEITSDILARTIPAIRGLDLRRVNRVAATVLKNVERDIIRARQREAALRSVVSHIDLDDLADGRDTHDPALGDVPLQADLQRLIGADARLVLRVAVEGFSQAEAAVEIGLSETAARKRYQRATRKLRDVLQEIAVPMSQSAGAGGFWNVNAVERPTPTGGSFA